MKVFISADLEGISGVVAGAQIGPEGQEYERVRRLMTGEVNAAVEGALAAGATDILVNDAHWSMRNILLEDLHPAARLISGTPKPLCMMQGIDEGFDVAFFVGYHAQAGTPRSVLDHTYAGIVYQVLLNGQPMGETGLNAALAGYFGVPVVLLTGDKRVVEEGQALLGPRLRGVVVKESYGRVAAKCLPPSVARERIRAAAEEALRSPAAPFRIAPPITLTVDFTSSAHVDMAECIPGVRREGGRRVTYTHEDYLTLYKVWRALLILAHAS